MMMNAMSATLVHEPPQPGMFDKARTLGACAVAAAVFLTVGWMAMAPDDPLGAVSLLSRGAPAAMFVQTFALSLLAAGAGTLIAGRLLPDIGTLAACIGLGVVSFRGATAESLLIDAVGPAGSGFGWLGVKLLLEAAAWVLLALGATLFSAIIARWCHASGASLPGDDGEAADVRARSAALDFPYFSRRWFGVANEAPVDRRIGFMHAGVVGAATLVLTTVFIEGFDARATQHAQTCFVVAAAVAIGSYFAHRFCPVRSAAWTLLGVWAACIACYLWGAVTPGHEGGPVTLSWNPMFRILPIQFVASGTASAIFMFWNMAGEPEDRSGYGGGL